MKRSYRRNRNPQSNEKNEKPFFPTNAAGKANERTTFFQAKGIAIGKPGDKYEQEADAVANAVVKKNEGGTAIQKKEINSIQRESLATPIEDEKLNTAEQRMEKDKLIQRQTKEEEEAPIQAKEEERDEEVPALQQMEEGQEEEKAPKVPEQEDEEDVVQAQAEGGQSTASAQISSQIKSEKGKGKPLSGKALAEMESGFGSDFSDVTIHTDSKAVEMNKQLHARAFTHGKDIYFNSGSYNPDSSAGKRLLAHELTHVVQQNGLRKKSIQRITCSGRAATAPARAAAGQANPLDQRAQSIINIAANARFTNVQKATRLITAIVCQYYPQHAGLVRNISFVANTPGLMTTSVGRGTSARGDIEVGNYFITNTTSRGISRRILQVGHELRHILQYRRGLTGGANKNEREFLAFHENALADEFVGTGRMSRGTRRNLIDAALGYYYCLPSQKQTQYAAQKQGLLTKRQQINQRAGSGPTNAPTTCAHP